MVSCVERMPDKVGASIAGETSVGDPAFRCATAWRQSVSRTTEICTPSALLLCLALSLWLGQRNRCPVLLYEPGTCAKSSFNVMPIKRGKKNKLSDSPYCVPKAEM